MLCFVYAKAMKGCALEGIEEEHIFQVKRDIATHERSTGNFIGIARLLSSTTNLAALDALARRQAQCRRD